MYGKYLTPRGTSPPSLIFSVLSVASRHFSKSASRVKKFRARDSKDMELTAIGHYLATTHDAPPSIKNEIADSDRRIRRTLDGHAGCRILYLFLCSCCLLINNVV